MPLFCNHGLEPSETISLKSNVFLCKLPWSWHFIVTKGKNYDNHTFLSCKGQTKSQKFWEGKCIVPMVDPANEVHFLTDWKKYINMTMKRSWQVSGLRNRSCAELKDRKWRTWDVPRRRSSSGQHLLYGLTHVRCHFLIHTTKLSLWLSDWTVHRSLETVRSPWLTLGTLQRLQLPLSFISII